MASQTYLVPNVQVLCERISSCGAGAVEGSLDDVVKAVEVDTIEDDHAGQLWFRCQGRVFLDSRRGGMWVTRNWRNGSSSTGSAG